ncbi:hypothetical protein T09_11696 [Trichinella sp. T9]|nr:hypothetical protein T09_11696 [Trichinella sp. T9]
MSLLKTQGAQFKSTHRKAEELVDTRKTISSRYSNFIVL